MKLERIQQHSRKLKITTIVMALLGAAVWLGLELFERAICFSGIPQVVDMDWERRHQGTLFFRVDGETKSDVFYEAIKQLERRNFTVCYVYLDPVGANIGRPCVGGCGTSTSLQEGIIVAERGGLARRDDQVVSHWSTTVYFGLISAEGGTTVVGNWIMGGRLARADWDGDLDRAEGPHSLVQTREIWKELSQNFGNDVRHELKDDN